jgi:glyoxylase-like metal-dependent hydrolase (beta-lactamase superfamily II)
MGGTRLTRRAVLVGAAVAGATTWVGLERTAHAEPRRRASAANSMRVGGLEVVALLDASGPFPASWEAMFPTAAPADWDAARLLDPEAFGADGLWHLDFHCFAIRRPGGRVTLIDSGIGPAGSPASSWAPVPGALPEVLVAAGIAPDAVDVVVLTHLHEDHAGWAVGPDGVPMFQHADYLVQGDEVASLSQSSTVRSYVVEPLQRAGRLHEIHGTTRLRGGGRGSGDRVTAIPTPGHTAGHQSVVVDGGGRQVIVTGDVLVHAVQLVNPEVEYFFEADKALAKRTRGALLGGARWEHAVLATAHLNQPFVPA